VQRGGRFWATLLAVALVAVLTALDQTVVATALPHMITDLEGAAILGWVFTAYFLSATATVTVAGKLADLFGRRGVFSISIVIFLVGSLLCGLATNMPMLVLFRAIQGVGAGSINTMSFVVMGDLFSPRERGKWQAVNNIGFATASAVGPWVGGVLSDNFSWRWIFLINVPVCLLTLGVVHYGLVQSGHSKKRPIIDWAGAVLSVICVIALLLLLTWGGREYAWTSPEIVGLIVLAAVSGGLLWRVERTAPDPLIPGGILRGNVAPYMCVGCFATFFVWFTMILLAPLRLQLVLGATATEAGALLTPGIVLSPFAAFTAGQITSRVGRCRAVVRLGSVLQVLGLAMAVFMPANFPQFWILLSFTVVGLGTGFTAPSMMIAFQNALPLGRLGAGMGLMSLFRQFGASVGTTVIGAIVGASLVVTASVDTDQAIQRAVLVQLAAGVLVVLMAWLMADPPLGTARVGLEPELPTRTEGRTWAPVPVEH
jgi:EmrB/QacA subfamily drug resistance transporter